MTHARLAHVAALCWLSPLALPRRMPPPNPRQTSRLPSPGRGVPRETHKTCLDQQQRAISYLD